jgi:hypothetical protein
MASPGDSGCKPSISWIEGRGNQVGILCWMRLDAGLADSSGEEGMNGNKPRNDNIIVKVFTRLQ